MSNLSETLKRELTRDWRRTGILAVLLVVGLVQVFRVRGGAPDKARAGSGIEVDAPGGRNAVAPTARGGAISAPPQAVTAQAGQPAGPQLSAAPTVQMLDLLRETSCTIAVPQRDPFAVDLSRFPPDPSAVKAETKATVAETAVDPAIEMQRRLAMEAALRAEAGRLKLSSIWLADPPTVTIDREVYRVGQRVGSFTIVRINARSVVLEKDGFEVMLSLE